MTTSPATRRTSSSGPKAPRLPTSVRQAFAYAERVVAGKEVAGQLVRLACERHLRDLERGPSRGLAFDAMAADRALRFFPTVLRHSKGEWGGRPVELEPWQKFRLASVFGWKWRKTNLRRFKRAYNTIGRKNGKSCESAGIGLYMLTADQEPGAEIYSYATKKDQAKIVWAEGRAMVRKAPRLLERLKLSQARTAYPMTESWWDALSNDEDTLDGLNTHLAIADEVHAHRNRAAYDVIDTSMGARRQPLHWVITTRGANRFGICGELDDYSIKVLRGEVVDDSWFAFVACIDDDDEWDDERAWKKANPNLGISVKLDDLRDLARKAKAMPSAQNEFRRKRCNLWTDSIERWVDYEIWRDAALEVDPEDLEGRPSWWGLDLSGSRDLTALVGLYELSDGRVAARSRFWLPEGDIDERERQDRVPYTLWRQQGWLETTPGNSIDRRFIADAVAAELSRPGVVGLAYDRWRIKDLLGELDALGFQAQIVRPDGDGKIPARPGFGVPLVEAGQGFRDMSPAVDELECLLAERRFLHGGNPVLSMCASNAVLSKDPAGNRKFAKDKATGRIDGVVAAAMACMLRKRMSKAPAGLAAGDIQSFFG